MDKFADAHCAAHALLLVHHAQLCRINSRPASSSARGSRRLTVARLALQRFAARRALYRRALVVVIELRDIGLHV